MKLWSAAFIFLMVCSVLATRPAEHGFEKTIPPIEGRALEKLINEDMRHVSKTTQETKDIFWRRLIDRGVTILEEPEFEEGTGCHEEWSEYGNLCEITSLTAFAEKESQLLNRAAVKMAESLNKFQRVITRAFKLTSQFRRANLNTTEGQKHYSQTFATLDKADLNHLLERIKSSRQNNSLKKCWKKIADLRSSGLCAICSGRHSSFIEDNKVLITKKTCDGFLSDCVEPFSVITSFVMVAQKIAAAFKSKPGEKSLTELRKKSNNINALAKRIRKTNISRLIDKYLAKRGPLVSAELCSMLISVSKDPSALNFARMLSRFNFGRFNFINNKMRHTLLRSSENSSDNWSGTAKASKLPRVSRLLSESLAQFANPLSTPLPTQSNSSQVLLFKSSDFFVGDIKVQSSVDSSYNAFLGANGTSGNEGSHSLYHLPLNMTNRFP